MSKNSTSTFILILLAGILIVGIIIAINLYNNSLKTSDSSVSDNLTSKCYRCTSSLNDGNTCEEFSVASAVCPAYSSSNPSGCAEQNGGQCTTIGSKICYKCTDITTDGNTCESFVFNGSICPSGSSDSAIGCALAAGGSCPQSITCYKCTARTDDGNTCESFSYIGVTCPVGSSTFSNGCAGAMGGSCSTTSVDCGAIDVNGDNKLTIIDLQAFNEVYGKKCNVAPASYPSNTSCGPKDVNQDGKIDIVDYQSFTARYQTANCFM
jgi:hypothetical protein